MIIGIDCGKSIEIDNGVMIYVGTSFPCLVTYECVDGFELIVGLLVYFVYTCGMSGSWVGEASLC